LAQASVPRVTPRNVRLEPQVVFRRLGEQMVLVHMGTNQIFELNETAARLWELLAQDGDVAAAESRLTQEYAVDPVELRTEVETTLAMLTTERLIVEAEDG
jgi:hypothetical protein